MEMFKTGIALESKIFNQKRITNSRIGSKFIFYPTEAISKVIFRNMMMSYDLTIMETSEVGKTLSIVMFILLADEINKFIYLANAKWIENQPYPQ